MIISNTKFQVQKKFVFYPERQLTNSERTSLSRKLAVALTTLIHGMLWQRLMSLGSSWSPLSFSSLSSDSVSSIPVSSSAPRSENWDWLLTFLDFWLPYLLKPCTQVKHCYTISMNIETRKFSSKTMITYRWKFLLLLCFCGSPFLSLKLELVPDPPLKSLIFGRVAANFLPE